MRKKYLGGMAAVMTVALVFGLGSSGVANRGSVSRSEYGGSRYVANYGSGSEQTISNDTLTTVIFNTTSIDNLGSVSNQSSTSWNWYASSTGTYRITANVTLLSHAYDADEDFYLYVIKNGGTYSLLDWQTMDAANTKYVTLQGSDIVEITNTGHPLHIEIKQRSGTNDVKIAADQVATYVTIERVFGEP